MRVTLMETTDAAATRQQHTSRNDQRWACHRLMTTQARKASETFASDEQYGRMIRLPEPSANDTMLPLLPVPTSKPTNEASMLRMTLAKNRNSRRLQSIGTVAAKRMMAPRRRADNG